MPLSLIELKRLDRVLARIEKESAREYPDKGINMDDPWTYDDVFESGSIAFAKSMRLILDGGDD